MKFQVSDLSPEQLRELQQAFARENGRKGGQVKSEKKRIAGQKNIAKASARLAEIRAAKRILAGKKPKGQSSTNGKIAETS